LPSPSQNTTQKKSGCGHELGELPKNSGFPLNICAMAESIDFEFGTQFRWPIRPIIISHKMTQMTKVGLGQSMVRSVQNYAPL